MKKLNLILALAILLFACKNDDDTIALCEKATNITIQNITTSTANITWNDPNNAGSYIIEFGVSGFMIGTGNSLVSSTTSITLSNLNADSTYDVYIQTLCSINNLSLNSNVVSFTTSPNPIIPDFRQNLSELNIFKGDLGNLRPSDLTFEYNLHSSLFTDYAHKQRLIALPEGEKLTYDGDGLPLFPDNTVIIKTFYYNVDDRDESLGKTIIESRVLIKTNGLWETGDYKWNDSQTDAILDLNGSTVPVSWTDSDGNVNNINYEIPSNTDCFTCHQTNGNKTPIGPKLRTLNFNVEGVNQLQTLINNNLLEGLSDPNSVNILPKWDDSSFTLEERARGYFDINCAHCHIDGAYCANQSTLRLSFETPFNETNILNRKNSILNRISTYNSGFSMPFIGTTILHDEGVQLLQDYLNTL